MTRYAENTTVPVDRSKAEIEKTLQRYGADQFISGWNHKQAVIGFRMNGRFIRFNIEMPDRDDEEFTTTPTGKRRRNDDAAYKAWEQACRQRWRALALVIKAKLEAVETGISDFEDEFLAWTMLPNGQSVSDFIHPQIEEAYATGKMPSLLPWMDKGERPCK